MWPFSKKRTIAQSGILAGYTDHHSHILPGVDDGVESMDEALRILATYEAAGVKELWLTPHIMEDIPNTPDKLRARFAELTARYKGSITLHLAAEYMIDNHLRSLLMNCHSVTNNCPSFQRGTSNAGSIAQGVKETTTKLRPALEGRWHEQGEVTEGSSTNNNSPSFERGTSNAGSIAEGVKETTTKLRPALEGRWHEQGEVTEGSSTNNNSPSFERGTSNAGSIAEGVKETTTKLRPASEGRRQERSEVTEGSSTNNNCPSFNEGQRGGALHGKRAQETALCHFEPKGEISTTKEELLPIGTKGNHLLVETSYFNPPMRLHETLRQIKSLGYHPLLAHPERYMYMDEEEYIRLHQEGVKFQLNLPSICGGYGNTVKKRAQWLLKKGLYDVIGSDTHCEEGVEYLLGSSIRKNENNLLTQLQTAPLL